MPVFISVTCLERTIVTREGPVNLRRRKKSESDPNGRRVGWNLGDLLLDMNGKWIILKATGITIEVQMPVLNLYHGSDSSSA